MLGLQTESGYPHQGTLDFANTGLDTGSGTLQLRAVVPNPERLFLPGLFARLRIALDAPTPRLTVPDRIVGNDQVGAYVFLVSAEHKVVQQRVETGSVENGMRAVLSGLAPDSEVVVDGLQNAIAGNTVTPVEQPLTPSASPPGPAR